MHAACRFRWLVFSIAVASSLPCEAADDLAAKFRGVKARLTAQLRSPLKNVRDEALAQLGEYPIPAAADVLLTSGVNTSFPDVGRGCYDTLRSFANSPAVASHLAESLKDDLQQKRTNLASKVKLDVLLIATEPQVKALVPDVVDLAQKSPVGLLLLATLIDEFAASGNGASQQALLRLVELPLFTSHAGLRRALVQALCKINDKAAVQELVAFYSTAEGETRLDIERRLYQLSGLKPVAKPDFATWWQDKKADFVFPSGSPAVVELPAAGRPSYYGLPVYGSKLIFIIDFSGSMRGEKIAAAQRELIATIAQLPDGVYFNIIAFNSVVFSWKEELVPTSPDSRKEAMRFVGAGIAADQTASYDALRAALRQNCDAIYFLTDGEPAGGEISNPFQIVARISEQNRVRRATIHSIGIGVGGRGGTFDTFLSDLATKNFGAYRRLD